MHSRVCRKSFILIFNVAFIHSLVLNSSNALLYSQFKFNVTNNDMPKIKAKKILVAQKNVKMRKRLISLIFV